MLGEGNRAWESPTMANEPRNERSPMQVRPAAVWSLAFAAVLLTAIFLLTGAWIVHWNARPGLIFSLTHGTIRMFAWDTRYFAINYAPGVAIEDEPYALQPGFTIDAGRTRAGQTVVAVPLWPLALATWLAAGLAWRSARRRRPWECRKCGYNLTGNTSGVCSECGTPISEQHTGSATAASYNQPK